MNSRPSASMLCTRCLRASLPITGGLRAPSQNCASRLAPLRVSVTSSSRSFSLLSLRRPQLLPQRSTLESPQTAVPSTTTLFPFNPATSTLQVRNHRRATYDPSHRVRKRRHGFLARLRTRKGRATLLRRRLKGRGALSH